MKLPATITPGWNYVLFTNQDIEEPGVWEVRKIESLPLVTGPKRLSRYFKIAAPPEGETTVYIDATYQIAGDLNEFVAGLGSGVHMTPHPMRNCIYDEFKVIRQKKLDDYKPLEEQERRYRESGYPINNGLYRCGVIVRKGDCSDFNEAWWDEIERGSYRDQISAPVVAHKIQRAINPLPRGLVEKFFKPHLHKPKQLTNTVWYNPPSVGDVPKTDWVYVGEVDNRDYEAVRKYPLVHMIQMPKGILFQRWLYDYIPYPDKMLEYVKIYRGTYAFYV